jgi:hypothetical protein
MPMLSNVTKTADCLKGNTQMQDLWIEVERETSSWHMGLPPPKQIQEAERLGRRLNEEERRAAFARLATIKQQRTNFYKSTNTQNLQMARTDMPASERKASRSRLYRRPEHKVVKPKSETNLGHKLDNGEHSPNSPNSPVHQKSPAPKSRAAVIPATVRPERSGFRGLTKAEFANGDWRPSLEYKPAKQEKPWENVEGFAASTRTLERRKLDPFFDINSFTGNFQSASKFPGYGAHVRPLDCKGMLGAAAVQKWKMTLREDFANDNDNASSNLHDAMLDNLRKALASGTGLYAAER